MFFSIYKRGDYGLTYTLFRRCSPERVMLRMFFRTIDEQTPRPMSPCRALMMQATRWSRRRDTVEYLTKEGRNG